MNERNRSLDTEGYGKSDRGTYKYRADLLDTAIAVLRLAYEGIADD